MIDQIKKSKTRRTDDGKSIYLVRDFIKNTKKELEILYKMRQKIKFQQSEVKLVMLQDKLKLIEFFKNMSNQEFYQRYTRRYEQLLPNMDYIRTLKSQFEKEYDSLKQQLMKMQEFNQRNESNEDKIPHFQIEKTKE
jgi:DNA repair ATPase RecN